MPQMMVLLEALVAVCMSQVANITQGRYDYDYDRI